jgi:hypothetical protein
MSFRVEYLSCTNKDQGQNKDCTDLSHIPSTRKKYIFAKGVICEHTPLQMPSQGNRYTLGVGVHPFPLVGHGFQPGWAVKHLVLLRHGLRRADASSS